MSDDIVETSKSVVRNLIKDVPLGLLVDELPKERNEERTFYDNTACLRKGNNQITGHAKIYQRWLPTPSLRFEFIPSETDHPSKIYSIFDSHTGENQILQIKFEQGTREANVLITKFTGDHFEGVINGQFALNNNKELVVAKFGLVNMSDFHGSSIRYGDDDKFVCIAGRLQLRAGGFNITIDGTSDGSKKLKEVEGNGGYVITHHCELRRENDASFNYDDLCALLQCLGQFLGFAMERWFYPTHVRGYAADGSLAVQELADGIISPFKSNHGWFAHRDSRSLEQLWPLFFEKWQDEYSRGVLRTVLWWFVGASLWQWRI